MFIEVMLWYEFDNIWIITIKLLLNTEKFAFRLNLLLFNCTNFSIIIIKHIISQLPWITG